MKKPKIPDWWRCRNCKFWEPETFETGQCWNKKVFEWVQAFGEDGILHSNIEFHGDRGGCIYFEPREENNGKGK